MANPFLPTLSPEILAALRSKGILQAGQQPQDFASTLAQAGLQAPQQGPQPTTLNIPTTTISAPRPGANTTPEDIDARNEAFQRTFASMTPEQRAASMQASAAGVQGALGSIEAPRKVEKPAEAATQGAVFADTRGGAANQQAAPASAAPQTRTIAAHELSTVSPETEREFQEVGREKTAAAEKAEEAEQGVSGTQADVYDTIAHNMAAQRFEAEQQEGARQRAMKEQQDDYTKLANEFASGRPDYNRVFRPGTPGGVLAGIAAALGAAGQVFGHTGENQGAMVIKQIVDRDVAQQEADLDKKGKRVGMAAHSLAMMRERFGDERAAQAGERAKQLEAWKLAGDAEVARAQSPVIAAKWAGVRADIQAEQAKLHAQMHQWVQAQQVTTGNQVASGEVSDVSPNEVLTLRDGRQVTVPEKDREKVVTAQNKADEVKQAGDAVKRLTSMSTADRLAHPIDWTKEYNAAVKTLAAAEIEAGGRGGKGIFEQFQKAAGGRTLVWTPGVDRAVSQIVAAAQRGAEDAVHNSAQYEVRPVLVRHVDKKTGEVEQRRKYVIVKNFERPKPQGAGDQFIKKAGTE